MTVEAKKEENGEEGEGYHNYNNLKHHHDRLPPFNHHYHHQQHSNGRDENTTNFSPPGGNISSSILHARNNTKRLTRNDEDHDGAVGAAEETMNVEEDGEPISILGGLNNVMTNNVIHNATKKRLRKPFLLNKIKRQQQQ